MDAGEELGATASAEAEVTLSPTGPGTSVAIFLEALRAGELPTAWGQLHPSLKRVIDPAGALTVASEPRPAGLGWLAGRGGDLGGLARGGWAISGRSRPVGIDTELVLLVRPPAGSPARTSGTTAYPFLVQLEEGRWLIAGIGADATGQTPPDAG